MRFVALPCLLGLVLVGLPARTQTVNLERPPEIHQQVPSVEAMRSRLGNLQVQNDAKQLGELCAAVHADMDGMQKGLLPKDIVEKLKRVEKLSKRLREELTR